MEIIADLHIHSRYSMATSKLGTPEYLDLWARKKGISLVGTGDFTHPAWRNIINLRLDITHLYYPAKNSFQKGRLKRREIFTELLLYTLTT